MTDIGYIKPRDLKDGYLYRIVARNAPIGIWYKDKGVFMISRFKPVAGYNCNYCSEEVHWDLSQMYGTAKPIEEIERAPFFPADDFRLVEKVTEGKMFWTYNRQLEILDYLNEKREELAVDAVYGES